MQSIVYEDGEYEGNKNELGERHGKGKCVWVDGTVYEGEWLNNKKHGYGELKRNDGFLYRGNF